MDAPEALDATTEARLMESARQYAGALHRLEVKRQALREAHQAAQKALARGLTGEAEAYLKAQLRMSELALRLMKLLPLEERVLTPASDLLKPGVQAMQVELQWCQVRMEVAFVAQAWPWLRQDLPPQAEAPEDAPEGWLALRERIASGEPAVLEALQRAAVGVPPLLEGLQALEAQAVEVALIAKPESRAEAWLALGVAPLAGLAYRVESPLRQVPGLQEAWHAWRRAWVAAMVPPPGPPRPSLGARAANTTKRLTARLSAPLQGPKDAHKPH